MCEWWVVSKPEENFFGTSPERRAKRGSQNQLVEVELNMNMTANTVAA